MNYEWENGDSREVKIYTTCAYPVCMMDIHWIQYQKPRSNDDPDTQTSLAPYTIYHSLITIPTPAPPPLPNPSRLLHEIFRDENTLVLKHFQHGIYAICYSTNHGDCRLLPTHQFCRRRRRKHPNPPYTPPHPLPFHTWYRICPAFIIIYRYYVLHLFVYTRLCHRAHIIFLYSFMCETN